jgi:toxin YoeB
MRNLTFKPQAIAEFAEWLQENPKMGKRIYRLLEECCRTPFEGIGKPEPLKGSLSGYWSRRIDEANRLIYEVHENSIIIFSLRGHYGN